MSIHPLICHIATREDWEAAKPGGLYRVPSLDREGFIHFSGRDQVLRVAEAIYRDQSDLLLLVVDPSRLTAALKYEAPSHPPGAPAPEAARDEQFPHLYGPLNLGAVLAALPFDADPLGHFHLPDNLNYYRPLSERGPVWIPGQIETERLRLERVRPDHAAMILEGILESLEELRPWMPWAQGEQTLETTRNFAVEAGQMAQSAREFNFVALRKSDGRFLANIGMHSFDWSVPMGEIGYWARTGEVGQGYISEATRALTRLGFEVLGLKRIEIRCDANNTRSAAVARRCDYLQEALMRRESRAPNGDLRDTLVYAMIREEWNPYESS